MSGATSPIIGLWRIIEMALRDLGYTDIGSQAHLRFDPDGGGELYAASLRGSIECSFGFEGGEAFVEFTWTQHIDVKGSGFAVLTDTNELRGRIYLPTGGNAPFRATR